MVKPSGQGCGLDSSAVPFDANGFCPGNRKRLKSLQLRDLRSDEGGKVRERLMLIDTVLQKHAFPRLQRLGSHFTMDKVNCAR